MRIQREGEKEWIATPRRAGTRDDGFDLAMLEESDRLCHIQEGFIPTDIHHSYIQYCPGF